MIFNSITTKRTASANLKLGIEIASWLVYVRGTRERMNMIKGIIISALLLVTVACGPASTPGIDFTDGYNSDFGKCWSDNAGLSDSDWDHLATLRSKDQVDSFYSAHPQAVKAYDDCVNSVKVRITNGH
jgi:hypothetical protein